jgi:hypothetical protein
MALLCQLQYSQCRKLVITRYPLDDINSIDKMIEGIGLPEFTAPEMLASKNQMDVHNSSCTRIWGGDGHGSIRESEENE